MLRGGRTRQELICQYPNDNGDTFGRTIMLNSTLGD
jgi:hypothetical protein